MDFGKNSKLTILQQFYENKQIPYLWYNLYESKIYTVTIFRRIAEKSTTFD